jgi:predicted transcriptional regulator
LEKKRLGVNTRRSEIEIFADMLQMATVKVNKTTLLYQANLNYNLLQKYLAFLLERGLLAECGSCYITTPKGKEFLATLKKLQALLSDDAESFAVPPQTEEVGNGDREYVKQSSIVLVVSADEPGSSPASGDVKKDLWCRVIKILPSEAEAEKFLQKEGFLTIEKNNLIKILEKSEYQRKYKSVY